MTFIYIFLLVTEDSSSGRIVYDTAAIDLLLDRSKEGIIDKESGMDEYLSSFKVSKSHFDLYKTDFVHSFSYNPVVSSISSKRCSILTLLPGF